MAAAPGKTKAEAAPVVPFGMDLYYWDKPKDHEPMTLAPYVMWLYVTNYVNA